LPMALVAAAAAVLLALRVRGFGRQAAGASLFAVLGSAGAVALLHSWLGVLDGNWAAEFGIVALALGGISLGSLGMAALFGRAGLAVAVVTDIALGNPLSAAPSAPVLLPDGLAQLGQALPPGAMVSALRAVSGFGGTGAAGPVTVLVAWVAAGLVLLAAGALRGARRRSGSALLTG
jgi:hypothetical protein